MTDLAMCPNCEEYDGLSCEYNSSDFNKGCPPEENTISVWKCTKCKSTVFITTPRKK